MASCCRNWKLLRSFSVCGGTRVSSVGTLKACVARNYSKKQESKLWQQKPNRKSRLSIILTEDVYNLGSKGQIVKVKHGYGRNDLIPGKKAVYATHHNILEMNAYEVKPEDASVSSIEAVVDFLQDKTLRVQHDPNDISAIFEQHISMAFYKTLNLYVPLHCIELEEPITDFDSEHSVGVRLDEQTVVQVQVVVERSLSERKQRMVEEKKKRQRLREEKSSEMVQEATR
jgi:large subunit ribosomal protein L9